MNKNYVPGLILFLVCGLKFVAAAEKIPQQPCTMYILLIYNVAQCFYRYIIKALFYETR